MTTLCTQATGSTSTNFEQSSTGKMNRANPVRANADATLSLVGVCRRLTQRIITKYNQYIDRQAFKNVLHLDDRMLKDIGVTRQDVKWASKLPMSEDAAIKLEHIARRRQRYYSKSYKNPSAL